MRKKSVWIKIYEGLEDYLSGGLLYLGLTLIFVNVILRYVFGKPIALLDEYSVYLIVWGAMIGFATALRDDHHIKVNMLYDRLSPKGKRIVSIFANLVGAFFAILMLIYGIKLVVTYKVLGQGSADSQTPLWIVSLVLPISGFMMVVRFVEKVFLLLKKDTWQKLIQSKEVGL
ncbi:TRAP transporter small permease [Carboxydothermus ferrireducens]|uniref:C4-dicarboxylate transporter DctQ subunit n=1 Tax=Carboxydothermus ferrireducens DSM 11255 TaxID=1119529 RepID=A0ABX2RAC4_9THEO|nr:TRAP transporter small permease [Carboxydothermus ferrireducens]NYE58131.1 C4-dicarboxylate transporter DctQ subunit [Carboxydothermus ferrireducens DSM 11255]